MSSRAYFHIPQFPVHAETRKRHGNTQPRAEEMNNSIHSTPQSEVVPNALPGSPHRKTTSKRGITQTINTTIRVLTSASRLSTYFYAVRSKQSTPLHRCHPARLIQFRIRAQTGGTDRETIRNAFMPTPSLIADRNTVSPPSNRNSIRRRDIASAENSRLQRTPFPAAVKLFQCVHFESRCKQRRKESENS